MKERPILFSAPMIRALLAGTKTQTRRVFKAPAWFMGEVDSYPSGGGVCPANIEGNVPCPYGHDGERLWVRETWQYYDWSEDGEPRIRFAADNATSWPSTQLMTDEWAERLVDIWEVLSRDENFSIDSRARDRKWRPSIFMPRWASRITLEITDVRVQRLQEISEGDAIDEGGGMDCHVGYIPNYERAPHAYCYAQLWDSINGEGSWIKNPLVWALTFKRVDA